MATKKANKVPEVISNKRATYNYTFLDTYKAGIVLNGTEVKAIREGKANLNDSYCYFKNDELWVKNLHIAEYKFGSHYNHEPLRVRKLLLGKKELKRLHDKIKEKGLTIIPISLFFNERGFAKLEIALAKGKKTFDKRDSIKDRESKVNLDRELKSRRQTS